MGGASFAVILSLLAMKMYERSVVSGLFWDPIPPLCKEIGKCPVGNTWRDVPPTDCKGNACTVDECCEPLGRCTAHQCAVGHAPGAATPAYCKGTTCTEEECCEEADVCKANPTCFIGHLPAAEPPTYCQGIECTHSECCDVEPVLKALGVTIISLVIFGVGLLRKRISDHQSDNETWSPMRFGPEISRDMDGPPKKDAQ